MKKWLLIALTLVILSGCSWNKVWKWIDEMEFERDDQTVRIVDIFTKVNIWLRGISIPCYCRE